MLPTPEARRVPGPNLYAAAPGVVVEATWAAGTDDATLDAAAAGWRREVERATRALGWDAPQIVERRSRGAAGVYVARYLRASADALGAALVLAEQAWAASTGGPPVDVDAVRALADAEREPRLVALLDAADARALVATVDDEAVSVGSGRGARVWPRAALPAVADVLWDGVADVPAALVTGSNGKTTVTRLTAAILRAAGHTVGASTTDGVRVDGPSYGRGDGPDADAGTHEALEDGDWAGPGGARRVLRDPRVTVAVLETARGGMLRRGLAVRRAHAAVVTNVAADHLGEYGIEDLGGVADAKLVVARALRDRDATLVLPADDAVLAARGAAFEAAVGTDAPRICWTLADASDVAAAARVAAHVAAGGRACAVLATAADEVLTWYDGSAWHELARVEAMPLAAGGRARHNVANAAAAAALALALGAPLDAVRRGLLAFGAGPGDNPGRLERFAVGGLTVVVDYAHNPDGLAALHAATRALPAARRLLLLGQAGDRDDAALDALARAAWGGDAAAGAVDRVVLKELASMRRGRARGAVPARLRAALLAAGAPETAIDEARSEVDAVRAALAWARPGDLLLLPLHEARDAVVRWLDEVVRGGWRAGDPLPPGPAASP